MELIGHKPERKVVIYFLAAIMVGALLLLLPISSSGQPVSLIDALFTATSAICVTGLTVLDTGHDFSFFGQIVILILVQLGGIGIMTLATTLLITIVPKLSFQDRLAITQTLGGDRRVKPYSLLKAVMLTTFTVELIGAVMLFLRFGREFPVGKAVYYSVFHSISAFCNAGFSPFSNSLENYRNDLPMLAIFAVLIILGGLGFVVINELAAKMRNKKLKLSLHSKLCLIVTAALIIIGTTAFMVGEYRNEFIRNLGFVDGLGNAFFQAVTSRTAGFNAIPQTNLTEVSLLITIILMFIGACPGSTGGGVKTTTLAVLLVMAFNRFRGRSSMTVFKKSLGSDSINRALTVILVAILIIVVMFVMFMFVEDRPVPHKLSHGWFVEGAFEVMSAFGTVGLSLGATSHLHSFGKIIIILLMFTGRVGLLTLVFTLARPPKRGEIVYLDEQVMVG
ncbi:MAG: Trk family potassium uptake protein [candidate division Zixibacteria bacterium HGW-Zixibacteria-1]|nr:MAG: Trk family potassium uptake protein [candidate division Zixibacteria bacterium HGW-Zixibacteria-1]